MGRHVEVRIRTPEEAEKLRLRLLTPAAALASVGALMVAASHRAFEDQRLGDVIWPERYPAMRAPFINLAPVIQKAGEGRTPTADDFRRRPALGGSNSELAQSIAFEVSGNAVEIGTHVPFDAALYQYGGVGSIPITDTTRATLASWLLTTVKREPKKGGPTARVKDPTTGKSSTVKLGTGSFAEYGKKLAFVFRDDRTEFRQGAYARPFIGFGDTNMAEVEEKFAEWLGGRVA